MNNSTSKIVLVKDIDPGSSGSYPRELIEFKDKLYFTASDENGRELWVSDGTSDGTQLLKDIEPGTDSSFIILGSIFTDARLAGNFTEFEDKLYFQARKEEIGYELWVTDGTSNGTVLVKDINPGEEDSYPGYPGDFTQLNDKLYFSADDGVNGFELWVTDGTSEGTVLVKDINPGSSYGYANSSRPIDFTEFNGKLYFSATDEENGNELWVSDGTREGTQLLADISPGSNSSYPISFTQVNGKLYFSARDEENGDELWVSDGTREGTQLLADINPGSNYSDPSNFTNVNGKLYFTASNGVNGEELWITDGTSEGTILVTDINPGSSSSFNRYSGSFTEFDGKLYFGANDGENGAELWVSDGTSEGTRLVKDINPESVGYFGEGSSRPEEFTEFNGKLYFTANDGESRKLWVTDGTSSGTQLVSDINLFRSAFFVDYLTEANGELYFSADNGETGSELYKLVVENSVNTIAGTGGADSITGTKENDQIEGKSGRDTIFGAKGDDTIRGDRGNDELFGDVGNDNLFGGIGRDILNGGGGDDALYGDRGNDNLFGAIGDDTLDGGKGNDTLNGSGGNDILTGGGGSDVFILQSNRGKDRITDFEVGRDILSLAEGLNFSDLSFLGNKIISNEQILATLDGFNTQELTEASFEMFEI